MKKKQDFGVPKSTFLISVGKMPLNNFPIFPRFFSKIIQSTTDKIIFSKENLPRLHQKS